MHLDAYVLLGIFLFVALPIATNTDITGHEPSSKFVITSENVMKNSFLSCNICVLSQLHNGSDPEVPNTTANHKRQ